jgi:hypothetical protein
VTLDSRTIVLGVVALAAIAAAATATVANRRHTQPQRDAVSGYIKSANAIEKGMQVPLSKLLLAYRDFTRRGGPPAGVAAELRRATLTLRRLDGRLTRLPAPNEAATLRKRLLLLVHEQVGVAREVETMAVFSPRYQTERIAARTASVTLGKALSSIPVTKPQKLTGARAELAAKQRAYRAASDRAAARQADAVEAYSRTAAAVAARLERLRPPPAFAAAYRGELQSLRDSATAANRLAAALRQENRAGVPALGRRLTIASREARTLASQKAANASIRAYNRRVRKLAIGTQAVQSELLRLQRRLP